MCTNLKARFLLPQVTPIPSQLGREALKRIHYTDGHPEDDAAAEPGPRAAPSQPHPLHQHGAAPTPSRTPRAPESPLSDRRRQAGGESCLLTAAPYGAEPGVPAPFFAPVLADAAVRGSASPAGLRDTATVTWELCISHAERIHGSPIPLVLLALPRAPGARPTFTAAPDATACRGHWFVIFRTPGAGGVLCHQKTGAGVGRCAEAFPRGARTVVTPRLSQQGDRECSLLPRPRAGLPSPPAPHPHTHPQQLGPGGCS